LYLINHPHAQDALEKRFGVFELLGGAQHAKAQKAGMYTIVAAIMCLLLKKT